MRESSTHTLMMPADALTVPMRADPGGGFAVLVQDLDGGRGHVSFGRGTGEAHGLGFGGLLDVRALREGAFACGGPSMGAQALGSSAGDTCAGRAHGAGTCVAGGWQAPVPRARKLVFGGVRAVVELSMSSSCELVGHGACSSDAGV